MKRLIKQCELATIEGNSITLYKKNSTYYIWYNYGTLAHLISYNGQWTAIADFMRRIHRLQPNNYYITPEGWEIILKHYNKIMQNEETRSVAASSL